MEWIKRLNQAVSYIEEHLTEEIDYEELAKIACCSTYHFQRMFSYIADVTLSEYIRRRRMSMAAAELSAGKEKIVDIALKYGYDSPTAFNRAFQSVHHTAPSAARKNGIILKSYPPISFQITIKGDVEMNYRIETKESFRIIGPSAPMHKDVEKNFQMVPGLWTKAAADGSVQKLVSKIGKEPQGILGVSACEDKSEQWKYLIAVSSDDPAEEGWDEYIVPAATWAIFEGEGTMPESIQQLEKRIGIEWLPNSGYEFGEAPDIELYLNADPEHAKYEVWVPVKKKSE